VVLAREGELRLLFRVRYAARENNHGRFMELSKYGGGGRHSFIIVLKGQDGSGWGNCFS
jgi:hypothetical protein